MKAQFLKMAGVNSEEEFYNMYPTEEAFFQVYPEARQMANGGQPYPWSYPEYGMQGKGAGAQIPVETYYAFGGASNGPLGYFDDGGSAWNYGQFPAIAKKGNQVQGGKIDNVVETNKNNFLSAIQKNTNNALMNEASDEAFQMTQFAQYGKQTGSQFNPNMYNQNMFESRLDDLNNQSAQANRNVLGLAKFFTNNAINRKMQSIADQQKAQDEYYKNLETESGFKDAQTVPGFDPIPGNMAKLGGSLKKYQTGAQTGTPNYTSPTPPVSDLDINVIIEDTKKAGKNAAQKRKDEAELANIQELKQKRDVAIQRFTENPEGFSVSAPGVVPGGFGAGYSATPEDLANDIKRWDEEYKNAYNNYFSSRNIASTTPATQTPATQTPGAQTTSTSQCGAGQKWSSIYKICYTPITSNDQYYGGIGNSNKSAEQMAAEKEWIRDPNHLGYYEWSQTQPDTQQPAPAPAAPAKTQAKTPAPKAPAKPVAPVKKQITQSDTLGLGAFKQKYNVKKQGGQFIKYNGGGSVTADDGTFRAFEDGSIFNIKTNTWIQEADPSWKPEGVPPMTYKPGTEAKTETTPTTTPTTTGEMSAEEKAVRDFATAKGQNPDEVWKNYQAITSSYGTMGAGTQQPYGYGVSSMIPYRYKHRGYGSIGWDRGYVPGDLDLRAMEEQAMKMGYDFYGKSRPTLFGGRKVVIKTHYNPATGKVENKPAVVDTPVNTPVDSPVVAGMASDSEGRDVMVNQQPFTTVLPSREDQIIQGLENRGFYVNYPTVPSTSAPTSEPRQGFENADEEPWHPPLQRHGGALSRFLPKHQVLGETGFKFDNLDINVPIMDTFHNIKTGLTSINDFKQQRADARREKRGTDEKAVWKTGPSPYAADTVLTGMSALSNLARGKERRALEEKLATGKMSDKLFTSVEKYKGDYVPDSGALSGMFRPNQTTPIFDSGYDRGNAGRPTIGYDRGGSVAYSDWSQTPVNGYYGVPQGEFSPYSQWSQSPVKMQSGGAMMQDGVYDLTEDEINEIIQMGGQVEFLD